MTIHVHPVSHLKGRVTAPSSKSYSIRAFIIAACGGTSRISKVSLSNDVNVSMKAARALGAEIRKVSASVYSVSAHQKKCSLAKFNVEESGTVLRFMLPLASIQSGKSMIIGKGSLIGRPNNFLVKTLKSRAVMVKG